MVWGEGVGGAPLCANSYIIKHLKGIIGDELIIAALSVFPVGEGTSLSTYVQGSLKVLGETGLKFEPGAMATTIEAENLDELFSAVKKAHDAQLKMGAKRIYLVLTIDDRRDKEATIETKLNAVGF